MNRQEVRQLLDLIAKATNAGEPWKQKRKWILDEASDCERTNLIEFGNWFAEEEP